MVPGRTHSEAIKRNPRGGGPALPRAGSDSLDLGCGTGRLLLPLLASGLDVEGAHASPDMLAWAAELLLLLEACGFSDITVEGRYSGRPATSADGNVVLSRTQPRMPSRSALRPDLPLALSSWTWCW